MPGVPSSRGCQQCRKQKKKCVAIESSCQRCLRLGLKCIGVGEQRYKFITEGPLTVTKATRLNVPFAGLHNDESRLISAMARAVDPSVGIDISLSLNFGGFLMDIPRRLGKHKALDATADAFLATYAWFKSGRASSDARALKSHGTALRALAECLNDPVVASKTETLCAIHLMLVYQSFLGANAYTSHAVGVAEILKARGKAARRCHFEETILMSQRGSLVVEGLVNDRIQLSEQDWHDLVDCKLDITDPDGLWLHCLVQLRSIMRRARTCRELGTLHGATLASFAQETHALRAILQKSLDNARKALHADDLGKLSVYTGPPQWRTVAHAVRSRRYGLCLTAAMVVNRVASNFYSSFPSHSCFGPAVAPDPSNLDFMADGYKVTHFDTISANSTYLAIETLLLAEVAKQYRPFGSMYMILCLSIAQIATDDPDVKAKAYNQMQEYRMDFAGLQPRSMDGEQQWLEQRFSLCENVAYDEVFQSYT